MKKSFIPGGASVSQQMPHWDSFTLARVGTDFFLQMQTIVSMSTRTIHDNPDPFSETGSFKPERWLGEKGKELETWNVAFSNEVSPFQISHSGKSLLYMASSSFSNISCAVVALRIWRFK